MEKIKKVTAENDNIPLIVGNIDIKKFLELKKLLIKKNFNGKILPFTHLIQIDGT